MAQSTLTLIYLEARALLNDVGAAVFTDAVLAPYGLMSYRDMQLHLMRNNIPIEKEVAANKTVAALATTYTSPPADMIQPVSLFERTVGSTNDSDFVEMHQMDWEPNTQQVDTLRFWAWREETIVFVGSTAAREVRLRYIKGLPAVAFSVPATVVPVQQADAYMAPRIAELASLYIGNNPSRAEYCAEKADEGLEMILSIAIKNKQGVPAKRRPYRGRNRGYFSRIPRA